MIYKSFDELIEKECKWKGAKWRGRVYTWDLIDYCKELNIEVSSKDDKTALYNKLIQKTTHYKIYLRFRENALGINSYLYEEKFGISRKERLKMIEKGFIKIRYYVETTINSKLRKVPYADSHQFFKMTKEKIDKWLEDNN